MRLTLRVGARQREQMASAGKIGEARLVRSGAGSFALRLSCFMRVLPETNPTDWLGVDIGIVNLAADSEGHRYSGAKVECVRTEHVKTRSRLQKAASEKAKKGQRPKNIKRKLKTRSGKESRFMKDVNHRISKDLVAGAQGTGRGIALEDLQGIRGRNRLGKQTHTRVNRWAFAQLRSFVVYKALLAGVAVVFVDPRNTSRECSECAYTDKRNRKTQAEFRCLACGFTTHADLNAPCVIRKRAAVSRPIVSRPA
uniref:Transposase, IS605 OrfB family, central region n=2 Tax=Leptospirillum ferriphilum TaxID=178606 RepID=A0A2I2MFD1_9BACT